MHNTFIFFTLLSNFYFLDASNRRLEKTRCFCAKVLSRNGLEFKCSADTTYFSQNLNQQQNLYNNVTRSFKQSNANEFILVLSDCGDNRIKICLCKIVFEDSQVYLRVQLGSTFTRTDNEFPTIKVNISKSPTNFGAVCLAITDDGKVKQGFSWLSERFCLKCKIDSEWFNFEVHFKDKQNEPGDLVSSPSRWYKSSWILDTTTVPDKPYSENASNSPSNSSTVMWNQKFVKRKLVKRETNESKKENKLYPVTFFETPSFIQVLNKTEPEIYFYDNGTINIIFIAQVIPVSDYRSAWYKVTLNEALVKPENVNRYITGNIIRDQLRMSNCDDRCAAKYVLKVKLGSAFNKSFTWQGIYLSLNPSFEVEVTAKQMSGENFVLWKDYASILCTTNNGKIEDLKLQQRPYGTKLWRDVNPKSVQITKSWSSKLNWTFLAEQDLQMRCINSTGNESVKTNMNVTGIVEAYTTKQEVNGHILLTCYLPMDDSFNGWWKENEAVQPEPVIINYTQVYTIDIAVFHPPWGTYDCLTDEDSLKVEVLEMKSTRKRDIIVIWAGIFGIIFLVACLCLMIYQFLRYRSRTKQLKTLLKKLTEEKSDKDKQLVDETLLLHERVEQLSYDDKYEIQKCHIIPDKKQLGQGEFGVVWLCRLKKDKSKPEEMDSIQVAVKTPRDKHNAKHYKALINELRILIAVGIHPNVLCFIGAVVRHITEEFFCLVFELCRMGDLRRFLMLNQSNYSTEICLTEQVLKDGYLLPNSDKERFIETFKAENDNEADILNDQLRCRNQYFSTSDLISFGYQIACGMEFLNSKMCIHRDLASRNILLTENRIARIADFGLARKDKPLHYMKNDTPVPIRWMSPEALKTLLFSEKSDVWSFGVLLWELFTFGEMPYNEFSDNINLYDHLCAGNHLQKPIYCPTIIFNYMEKCWMFNPDDRPTFKDCKQYLQKVFLRASPMMKQRIDWQLEKDRIEMHQYAEYRKECQLTTANIAKKGPVNSCDSGTTRLGNNAVRIKGNKKLALSSSSIKNNFDSPDYIPLR